jgi:thiol-disulfide isomerase/thioredoxin
MILFFLIIAQAPSFTLLDMDRKEVVLDSLLMNGPVAIDFWATWCKPCMKGLDSWNGLLKDFEKITFVGINEDGPRTRRKVPLTVASHKWKFMILLDDNQKVMKLFQVRAIPHAFVIGKDREILYEHIGFKKTDEELFRKKLELILQEYETSEENDPGKEDEPIEKTEESE